MQLPSDGVAGLGEPGLLGDAPTEATSPEWGWYVSMTPTPPTQQYPNGTGSGSGSGSGNAAGSGAGSAAGSGGHGRRRGEESPAVPPVYASAPTLRTAPVHNLHKSPTR